MTSLVFSIGPVQGFISQARRTSDGWVGSSLLSLMAAHAVRAVVDVPPALPSGRPATVVEPSLKSPLLDAVRQGNPTARSIDGDTSVPSLPNTVVVHVADADDAPMLGAHMATAVATAWDALAAEVWAALPSSLTGRSPVAALWHRQLGTLWEMQWGWGATSTDAFLALASRKALRDLMPPPEIGERCTVNPDRIALWDDADRAAGERVRDAVARQWRGWGPGIVAALEPHDAPDNLIKPNGRERLSAAALLRRAIPYCDNALRRIWLAGRQSPQHPHVFPSTSTVAVASYRPQVARAAMRDQGVADAVRVLLSELDRRRLKRRADPLGQFSENRAAVRDIRLQDPDRWSLSRADVDTLLRLDGDWFLYGDAVRNEHEVLADDTTVREAHRRLMRALDAVEGANVESPGGDPPVYYALAAMDGDSMGDFLREVASAGVDTASVSEVLVDFAANAGDIVHECNGRLVYAGGDDVIALFPVVTDEEPRSTVVDAVDRIRRAFSDAFEAWRAAHWGSRPWSPRTQSAGVMLAHHQAPLGRIITAAHHLLKGWAKQRAGRNACALQLHRRGTPSTTFAARWEQLDEASGVTWTLAEELRETMLAMQEQVVSAGIAHRLRGDLALLGSASPFTHSDRVQWIRTILDKSGFSPSVAEALRDRMAERIERVGRASHGDEQVRGFTAAPALIARFLHGGGREDRT